ncbi:hypothetical protein [Amycolatopsis palatopharyngis]|uniref:hypothetical protein n=1 Tax=Amycolatopsis palatopharyngis TaxID=187982 RepID=UPI000E234141|nr:hypothetical protein [Amycolatopsis palatopharyngis]
MIDVQCSLNAGESRPGKLNIEQDLTEGFNGTLIPLPRTWDVHTDITWDEMRRWSVGGGTTSVRVDLPDGKVLHGTVVVLDCHYTDDVDPQIPFPVSAKLVGTSPLGEAA